MKIHLLQPRYARLLVLAGTCALFNPVSANPNPGSTSAAKRQFAAPLSKLNIPASGIGKDWKAGMNMVLDEAGATIPNSGKMGLKSSASFDFSAPGNAINTITVHVYVFDSTAARERWQAKKCKFAGWQKMLREVKGQPYTVFETLPEAGSMHEVQRIAGFENVGLTLWSMYEGKTTNYLTAEHLFVQKIRGLE